MAANPFIRDLGDAAALDGTHYAVVDQGGDAKKTLLSALTAFVLASDSDIAAIAALSTTSFGRGLLTAANAAALATAAGVGTGNSPTFTALTLSNGQIAFPSTQVPSADPNTLDDYEEGTFTPTFTAATPPTGVTYTSQAGNYTKIGNLVQYSLSLVLSNKGSGGSGNARISGLPFTVAIASLHAVISPTLITLDAGYTAFNALAILSQVYCQISEYGSNIAVATIQWSAFANTSGVAINGKFYA